MIIKNQLDLVRKSITYTQILNPEFFVEPEGWRIVEINPYHSQPISNCLAIYRKHKPQYDMI